MKIGRRSLTDTKSSRQMTFDRDCLDEIGFDAGVYVVMYEKNKVTIVKETLIKDIIVNDEKLIN